MTPLRHWPGYLRLFAATFVIVSLAGYAIGLLFVVHNTEITGGGMTDHYHGNPDNMQFGKSYAEMLEIIHTHLLGMGVLFFATGLLCAACDLSERLKGILLAETMLSLLTTFGGLWMVSLGYAAFAWLVFPSSVLMVIGYVSMSVIILWQSLTPNHP